MQGASSSRFLALCQRLSPAADSPAPALYHAIEALHAHPPRAYHNLMHVSNLLTVFDDASLEAEVPDAVEFAIWFHDCIYVPGRSDNEERSADIATAFAKALDCDESFISGVRNMILATKHDIPATAPDARLTADIDLSVLAIPVDAYRENSRLIRSEFSFADDAAFNAGRQRFIETFLAKPSIYQTDSFRSKYEALARANLIAERDTLA